MRRIASDWKEISCGVPQGSVLGPLLFTLMANDAHQVCEYSKMLSYVDDTQMYLHCKLKDLHQGIERVSSDANKFFNWCRLNGFSPNLAKTQAIIIGSGPTVSMIDIQTCPNILVNGRALEYVNECKNLGVWFDNTLNWKVRVRKKINRMNSVLYSLKLHKHSLSSKLRSYLIETLIFPIIDYGSTLLVGITDELNKQLEVALNSCIRFVYRIPPWARVSLYRQDLNWLRVQYRRLYFLGCVIFKMLNFDIPPSMSSFFTRTDSLACLRRSDRNRSRMFIIPNARTQLCFNRFPLFYARFWNALPENVTSITNLCDFKSSLKQYLFDRQKVCRNWSF